MQGIRNINHIIKTYELTKNDLSPFDSKRVVEISILSLLAHKLMDVLN